MLLCGALLSQIAKDSHECAAPPPPGFPARPWLAISMRRSGSRWFVNLLVQRAHGFLQGGDEMNMPCARDAVGCVCTIYKTYAMHAKKNSSGFKTLIDDYHLRYDLAQFDADGVPHGTAAFARAVCELRVPFVFMWRQNVLRRLISARANYLDTKHARSIHNISAHEPHPKTEAAASKLRAIKPDIGGNHLVETIERELRAQNMTVQAFANTPQCGGEEAVRRRVFRYEELVESAARSAAQWGQVLGHLGVPRHDGDEMKASSFVIIHGESPVNETIANFAEVRSRLAGTPHEWMLHPASVTLPA